MGEGQRYNQSNHSSTIQRQPAMHYASTIYNDGIAITSVAGTYARSFLSTACRRRREGGGGGGAGGRCLDERLPSILKATL